MSIDIQILYIFYICVYIYTHTHAHTQSFTQILQHSSEGLVGFFKSFLLYQSENECEMYEYKEITLEIQPSLLHRCTEYSAS